MKAQTTRAVLILLAFVAGLAACFAVILVVADHLGLRSSPAHAAVGGPFTLTDQDGRTVTDKDFKGRPLLVFFGYTHCPDICPTTLFDMSEVLNKLGPDASKVNAVFVSVDPARDTPAKLKDYLSSFNPHLRGLTGTPEQIAAIAKGYRVYFKKVPQENGEYVMDHTAIVYLMDKDGNFVAPFNVSRKPEDAAADLRKYL